MDTGQTKIEKTKNNYLIIQLFDNSIFFSLE